MKEQQKRKIQQFHPEIDDGIDLRRCPLLQRKKGRFSVIGARIGSIVILGQFFDGLYGPTKFR